MMLRLRYSVFSVQNLNMYLKIYFNLPKKIRVRGGYEYGASNTYIQTYTHTHTHF